jgi:hypothetical protein
MSKIRISWPRGEVVAHLDASPNSRMIAGASPFESTANTWGEEAYFRAPVHATLAPGARDVVDPGTVCFWVEGSSLALPYGPTPASRGSECRLVAPVNVLGRIEGDPRVLAGIRDGDRVRVECLPD